MIGVIFNDHRMASRRSRARSDKREPWPEKDDNNQAAYGRFSFDERM